MKLRNNVEEITCIKVLHEFGLLNGYETEFIDRLSAPDTPFDKAIDGPWLTSLAQDYADPRAVGDRPSDLANALKYSAALFRKASEDEYAHKIMLEVQHLLKPGSALKELEINV